MAVGGTLERRATHVGAESSSRLAPATFTLHRQSSLHQQSHHSRDQRKTSMVSSAHHARALTHHHHHHHHHNQHQHRSMLSTQSAYYGTAALVNQTAVAAAAAASTQLLVHHPDYHHLNGHSFHHHQTTSQLIQQQYPANSAVSNLIHGPASISPSSNDSASIITDLTPDRPIGYGAFGVVWSVTDPRDGKRVALKKMPNVFQNLISSKRVFREIKMLCFFKHENVLSALDILQPPMVNFFQEIYVITELMESDLHKIIVSSQPLTTDHIKVFLYQILRGLKYLHSARILHRDIKPGNLLVNSNCLLKICDFGLARVEERERSRKMTQEVVTQYYRAPELLMGARYYTEAIDMWSVGCIFAELLGRRILFQAQTPIQQLDLILDLLGTPSHEDMRYACEPARQHVLRQAYKLPRLVQLSSLSSLSTNEATHLLVQMLAFNPDKRINCASALNHSYLSEGRARYHSCMCKCCSNSGTGETRRFATELEPASPAPFDNSFEKELTSVQIVKDRLHKEIMERCESSNRVPLCINPMSASFKNFASSSVAHPSELPPSPHCWE